MKAAVDLAGVRGCFFRSFVSLLFCAAILLPVALAAAAEFDDLAGSPPNGYVTDAAGMLQDMEAIEQRLRQIENASSVEMAVATIDSLPDDFTLEMFAVELFEAWGIGKATKDNGLLLLIARDEREFRLEVGYGLEGVIPDLLAKQVTETYLVPRFREGDFDVGVLDTVVAVEKILLGNLEEVRAEIDTKTANADFGSRMPILFLLSWIAGGGLFSGILRGVLMTIGAVIAYAVAGIFGLVVFAIMLVFVLAFSAGGGGRHFGSGGSFGGGFSGGGSGFGGFGGGMSGGGGFSGRW